MIQREVIIIFGRTGEGKTTLAKEIMQHFSRVVVFDTAREYHGEVITDFDDFVYFFEQPHSAEYFLICRFPSSVSYQYAAKLLFATEHDVLVVLEEADHYLGSVSFSDPTDPITVLVTQGRHAKIHLLAITQRPHLIAITLRAMCTRKITFCQDEPADLDYLEAWGFDAEEVRALPKFKHLEINRHDTKDAAHGEASKEDLSDRETLRA